MSKFNFVLFVSMVVLGQSAANASTISGNLRDANARTAVDSAVVTFTNATGGAYTDQSDAKGDYSITNIPSQPASGVLAVTKTGYRPFTASVSNVTINPIIDVAFIPMSGGTARLTGKITDQPTSNAVEGAQVVLLLDGYRSVLSPYDTVITARTVPIHLIRSSQTTMYSLISSFQGPVFSPPPPPASI